MPKTREGQCASSFCDSFGGPWGSFGRPWEVLWVHFDTKLLAPPGGAGRGRETFQAFEFIFEALGIIGGALGRILGPKMIYSMIGVTFGVILGALGAHFGDPGAHFWDLGGSLLVSWGSFLGSWVETRDFHETL